MDIVSNLLLKVSVLGAAVAADEVDELDASLVRLGGTAEKTSAAMGSKMLRAFTSLKTLAVGAGVYEAVKAYSGFNAQMERLQTQAGATTVEVKRQTKAILDMSVAVGEGPNSLAQGMYHLESAGYRGATATNMLRKAAELAQIGGASLTDTVTGLTAGMIAFGSKTMTAQKILAMMNSTVGTGDMTLENLNDAIGTGILATMKTLGLKFNDFGAAMATFGDMNIRGAAAANRLRMSLMVLVHPSEVATKGMAAIGLSQYQLAEALHSHNGLLAMLDLLHEKLKGASKITVETDLASIFGGGKNSAGMLSLYNNMGRLESKYKGVHDGMASFNKDWQETQHTLAFSLHQLEALGEVLLIKVGKPLGAVVSVGSHFLVWLARGKGAASVLRDALFALGGILTVDYIKTKLLAEDGFLKGLIPALKEMNILVPNTTKVWEFNGEVMADGTLIMEESTVAAKGLSISFEGLATAGKSLMASTGLGLLVIGLTEIVFHIKQVKHYFVDLIKFMTGQSGGILGKVFSFLNPVGLGYHAQRVGKDILGMFADGGTVGQTGQYLVGERGPEVVTLPAGATVTPNEGLTGGASVTGGTYGGGDVPLEATIIVENVMDGKTVSKVVHRQSLMAQSRQSGVRFGTGVTGSVAGALGV